MKRLPKWISAANFQGFACCRCTHKDRWWREKKWERRKGIGMRPGGNKWAFAQHPAPSGLFSTSNCFWFQMCTHWQSCEEQVVVAAYLLACFVSSLQSSFVNTAPVPRALKIPWCSYLLWQRELGLVSVLRFVHWLQREFFGMRFTVGFTLITLTSLSKETKGTKRRNRISIKMAFPEVGLSFLSLPATRCRNASCSLL